MSVTAPRRPTAPALRAADAPRARMRGLGLVVVLAVAGAALLRFGRETSFYFDEWNFVLDRRAWTLDALLRPHNEHLSVLPVLVYKLLFAGVGAESYVPYRLVSTALALLVSALVYVYARARVGELLALGAAALLALLGPGWLDLLWPFQIGFLGSLAAWVGVLLCLDRGGRRADVAAGGLLAAALACSSLGVPMLVAAAVEVVGRPDRGRRWPIVVVPAAAYAAWYVVYRESAQGFTWDNLFATPAYVANAAAGAAGAVSGLGSDWAGRVLALALVAALVMGTRRLQAAPWRLAALVALPLAFWVLTAVARAHLGEPAAPRYLYPGAVFLVLVAVEAARGLVVPGRALALVGALLAAALLANVGELRAGGQQLRANTTTVRGALAATELAGARFDPQFLPEPTTAPQVTAGRYLDAVRDLGSPVRSSGPLERDVPAARRTADGTLQRGYALALRPSPGDVAAAAAAPTLDGVEAATVATRAACVRATPQRTRGAVVLQVPAGGLLIAPSVDAAVALRRFADGFPAEPLGSTSGPAVLQVPNDGGAVPWRARVTFDHPVRLCGAAR